MSRTRGREEVLTGRVLDLGKSKVVFAVSVSLIGSSVGPSPTDIPESDVGKEGGVNSRCQNRII